MASLENATTIDSLIFVQAEDILTLNLSVASPAFRIKTLVTSGLNDLTRITTSFVIGAVIVLVIADVAAVAVSFNLPFATDIVHLVAPHPSVVAHASCKYVTPAASSGISGT